jgi:hypothetical protein
LLAPVTQRAVPQRRVRRVRRRASGPRGRHGCAPLTAVLCGVARAQLQLQMFKEHMELESQPGPDVTFGVPDGAEAYAGPLQGDEMRSQVRGCGPRDPVTPVLLPLTFARAGAAAAAA